MFTLICYHHVNDHVTWVEERRLIQEPDWELDLISSRVNYTRVVEFAEFQDGYLHYMYLASNFPNIYL